jgi:sugar phosphate isomerase/epimerase
MHPSISINTLCFPPAPLDILIETVARLGVAGVSPDLEQILAFGTARTAAALRDSGLAVATLTHRAFAFAAPAEAAAGRDRLMRTIDIAHEIGAQSIIMTTGGRGDLTWSEAADRFAEAVAPCAKAAHGAAMKLGIEPTSHLYSDASIAHRLADTVDIARRAGIEVMIDVFACWFDADIEAALAEAATISPVVQVSDYVYGDRGLPCRAVPGDGAVPLARLISAILGSGFDGWFDLEVIGPRLAEEGVEIGLARGASHLRKLIELAST